MADVSRFARSNRAQFILVSGLLIAVVLVALVLLLNATIYTENVATRGVDSGANDALKYQGTITGSVAGLVEEENEQEHTEWDVLETNVNSSVGIVVDRLGQQYLERGVIVNSEAQFEPGLQIGPEEDTFDDGEVVADVTDLRTFTLDPEELPEEGEPFDITVTGTETWTVSVYEENNVSYVYVPNIDCTEQVDDEIDFLDSDWCGGNYEWSDGVDDEYDIQFENGSAVNGEYELVAHGLKGEELEANHTAFVYGATIELTYRSSRIEYSTNETHEWEAPQ